MVETGIVLAAGFQKGEGAYEVRVDEGRGVAQRIIVMGLGGKMNHYIRSGDERFYGGGIGDIPLHEVNIEAGEVGAVSGVGEFIEHRNAGIGARLAHEAHEIGADKTGAASDEHRLHGYPV